MGGDYDSVLDTMTNVVGILVIIVAVTQLGVADAVTRSAESSQLELAGVSPEALEQARADRDRLEKVLAELSDRWAALSLRTPEDRTELERIRESLAELEAEVFEPTPLDAAEDREIEEHVTELQDLLAQLEEEERSIIEALLIARASVEQSGRDVEARPRLTVPFPDPKRAEGKDSFMFVCKGGRVYPVHWDELAGALDESLAVNIEWVNTEHAQADLHTKCKIAAQRIQEDPIQDEHMSIQVEALFVDNKPDLVWELVPVEGGGAGLEDLDREDSVVRSELSSLDPNEHWVLFRTWDDSFEEYIEARRIAEELGFAAGWTAYGPGERWRLAVMNASSGSTSIVPD